MRGLFLILVTTAALAATDWAGLLDNRVHFGAVIGGDDPFRRNDTEAFAPASTAKLLTAGAVLSALGPSYRYPTALRYTLVAPGTAGSLTLVGSGDPSWGLAELHQGLRDRLDAIAIALKSAGVTTVQGNVTAVAADPRWNAIRVPDGWKPGDTSSCEGSLAQAFNLNLNCATLTVSSPTRASWSSPGLDYPVQLAIRAGSGTSLDVSFTGSAYRVTGTWKSGSRSFTLPIFDTRGWAAGLLREALAAQGIRLVPGRSLSGGDTKQLVFYSEPLSELLKPFLKNSINMMGDGFLKTLGAQPSAGGDPSLLAPGLGHLYAFLRGYGDTRDLVLHDGSGLSRTSRIPPAFLYGYLSRITGESWFPALYAALPVAGVDGTLRNRMKGTPAEGRLRAKTGTLDGVYNLAGYVPGKGGYVPFVLYTKTTSSLSGPAKGSEDRVGARLASLHADLEAAIEPVEPYPFVPEHAGD